MPLNSTNQKAFEMIVNVRKVVINATFSFNYSKCIVKCPSRGSIASFSQSLEVVRCYFGNASPKERSTGTLDPSPPHLLMRGCILQQCQLKAAFSIHVLQCWNRNELCINILLNFDHNNDRVNSYASLNMHSLSSCHSPSPFWTNGKPKPLAAATIAVEHQKHNAHLLN